MTQLLKSLFTTNKQEIILKEIENNLNLKGIEYYKEDKSGWGTVIVFEFNGTKVFTNNIYAGEMDLRHYNNENSYHLI